MHDFPGPVPYPPMLEEDGWMGGWVDGWKSGWVDGWMGGWVDMVDIKVSECYYVTARNYHVNLHALVCYTHAVRWNQTLWDLFVHRLCLCHRIVCVLYVAHVADYVHVKDDA